MYIDDCVLGIDKIMHCNELIATPVNLGTSEMISINELAGLAEKIGGVKLKRKYILDAPKAWRTQQRQHDDQEHPELGAQHPISKGLQKTYEWIEGQYRDRKDGKRTVKDTI